MADEPILTIFGGSRPVAGQPSYRQAERLGRLAAQAGWAVATGGYSGTMEAASKGAAEAGGKAIGVTCQQIEAWRPLGANQWVTKEIRCQTLRDRLETLVDIGRAAIALPGGIGTLAEIALSWSWLQTSVIEKKPLIIVGDGWRRTFETMTDSLAEYIPERDIDRLTFAEDVDRAWQLVLEKLEHAGD